MKTTSLFHLADRGQPDVGGQPCQAKDAQIRFSRRDAGVDLLCLVFVQDSLCAPPGEAPDRVTRFELAGVRLRHCADRGAVERLVDLERLDVKLLVVHPPTHVGVDAGQRVLDEDLAVGELRPLYFLESECLSVRPLGSHYSCRVAAKAKRPACGERGILLLLQLGSNQ